MYAMQVHQSAIHPRTCMFSPRPRPSIPQMRYSQEASLSIRPLQQRKPTNDPKKKEKEEEEIEKKNHQSTMEGNQDSSGGEGGDGPMAT